MTLNASRSRECRVGAGLTVEQAAAGAVPLQSTKDTECFLTIVSISSARGAVAGVAPWPCLRDVMLHCLLSPPIFCRCP